MKIPFLVLLLCSLISLPVGALDDPPPEIVATNANQVLVEILSGIRAESGKIYGTTKRALAEAYDTVRKETPEVVREFLRWKIIHNTIWMGVFIVVCSVLYYWARKFKFLADTCPAPFDGRDSFGNPCKIDHGKLFYQSLHYAGIGVVTILLLLAVATNLYEIAKIWSAPRVYIIEYVFDTVQPARK